MFAVFLLSIGLILVISKKSITIGILTASFFLGFLTMPYNTLFSLVYSVFTNSQYLLLAAAVGIIPVIGTLLNETGLLSEMIANFRYSKKTLFIFSPGVLGLLPMPGGSLFSAPMVDKISEDVSAVRKASINEWYRHVFHLIYPLATALIIGTELASLNIYVAIAYIFPAFLVAFILGLIFLLKKVTNGAEKNNTKTTKFLKPLFIILIAPILDFVLKMFFGLKYLATFIGVSVSLILLLVFSKPKLNVLPMFIKKAKPWDFFLLILAIFLYQSVFINSGVPEVFQLFEFPPYLFLIVAGFSLGVLTGRLSTPLIISIPIFVVKFGLMSPLAFAILYYATMMGYVISPIHPCLVFTAQYFNVDVKEVMKDMTITTLSSLVLGIGVLFLFTIF